MCVCVCERERERDRDRDRDRDVSGVEGHKTEKQTNRKRKTNLIKKRSSTYANTDVRQGTKGKLCVTRDMWHICLSSFE